jgi:hypothetical protein
MVLLGASAAGTGTRPLINRATLPLRCLHRPAALPGHSLRGTGVRIRRDSARLELHDWRCKAFGAPDRTL